MAKQCAHNHRVFLFLQGPHGPFFHELSTALIRTGASTLRVGFNAGDQVFWRNRDSYTPFCGKLQEWPQFLHQLIQDHDVTDIVLYGDTRPVHAQAIAIGASLGLTIHVFEEGYLRPYWVTYERGGSNGHSPLINMPLSSMQEAKDEVTRNQPVPPSHWGDMRHHIFYGALYHWFVLFMNGKYPNFQPHRNLPVKEEFRLYFKRLSMMPIHAVRRWFATRRVLSGSFPYHLVLLQLEHDSSFQMHGEFESQDAFLAHVIKGFAEGAPSHHHLVFKAHPLENGRSPLVSDILKFARAHGIAGRVHFVQGGKLAPILDSTRSAVTVNSTAGQQVLWRGLPLRVFGATVYDKPELVSRQPIAEFFASPRPPCPEAYTDFRNFLLATSQHPGGFYSARGRKQVLRHITDKMLAKRDPYSLESAENAAYRQQLRVMK